MSDGYTVTSEDQASLAQDRYYKHVKRVSYD